MTLILQFSHTVVKSYFYLKPWSAQQPRTSRSYPSTHLPPSRGRADPVGARLRRRGRGAGGAAGLVGAGAGGQRQGAPAWALEQRGRPAAGRTGADGGAARKAGSGARWSGRRSCVGGRRGARRHGGREWRRVEAGVGRGAGIGAGCEAEDCARPGERTKLWS